MVLRTCEKVLANCLQIVGCHSDRDACNEATVKIPKLMAKLTDGVYDLAEKPGQKDYILLSCELEGYKCTSPDTTEPWYMVFEKTKDCKITSAPKAIIAVRGTSNNCRDYMSDGRVLAQRLHTDARFSELEKVVKTVIERFGHEEVSLAGHSLGATFVLLVGKLLVKAGKLVQTYLFNPPFASFDAVGIAFLRKVEKSCKAMLLAIHIMVNHIFDSECFQDRVILIREDYYSTHKWVPHIFLNKGDIVSLGYIHQIYDRVNNSGLFAKVCKWVEPHTLLSLITKCAYPKHLLPSFHFTIAGPRRNLSESHKLKQWYMDPEWKSGDQVEGLAFGRQLCQRMYTTERSYIKLRNSDATVMVYCQTLGAKVVQTFATTYTLGLATSKQILVIFLFNTVEAEEAAKQQWPSALSNYEINDCIRNRGNFEFQLHTVKKGDTTFYVYAVRLRSLSPVPFERELEWTAVIHEFEGMGNVTNWIKLIRH